MIAAGNYREYVGRSRQHGFTLIEFALVVVILGLLSSISIPMYRDYTEKAQLVDLQLRIDAIRTAMSGAYQSGERSMLSIGAGQPGQVPPELVNVPFNDSLTHPGLTMLLMSSDQQFGQFTAGTTRPYLVLGISGSNLDEARTLRNFSDIYPEANQAWWVPSAVLVIPLLDDGILGVSAPAQPPANQPPGSQGPGSTNPGTGGVAGTNPPATTNPPVTTNPPSQGPGNPGNANPPGLSNKAGNANPPGLSFAAAAGCRHPGKGHAYWRCRQ